MKFLGWTAKLLILSLLMAVGPDLLAANSQSSPIPLYLKTITNHGKQGFGLNVTFVNQQDSSQNFSRTLLFDTGSSGIRIFSQNLPPWVNVHRTGIKEDRVYGGGQTYHSEEAYLTIQIGDNVSPQPILVDLVDSVSCSPAIPNCVAANGPGYLTQYGIYGMVGTGMRGSGNGPFNPIEQLGPNVQGFTVVPGGGQADAALLLSTPQSPSLQGYSSFKLNALSTNLPNGATAWDDRSIPICGNLSGDPTQTCGPTMIDSGVKVITFPFNNLPASSVDSFGYLAANTSFIITDSQGHPIWSHTSAKYDTDVQKGVLLGGYNFILGMPFFLENEVYFDFVNGIVGTRNVP